jgi:2,5-diketo-D-gluconate reductase B
MMQTLTAGGMTMPKLGLGTFRMTGSACTDGVLSALELGYRHIDTAQMYGNEAEIGAALAATSVQRGDIHLTTKVWWENLTPAAMRRSMETSLTKLGTDYVDLYLIHWPAPDMDLPAALEPIVCNQIEYHVLLDQTRVVEYCRKHDIAVTAYCPLARGGLAVWPALAESAARHGVTPEQVALQWLLEQPGIAAIPKASQAKNQQANLDAQQIRLTDADRAGIAGLPKTHRIVNPGMAPAWDAPV